ncbi:Ribosomal protein S4e [Corchorus capsularis]|uniref:Eukaryotic translation initiation factor 2A n=1 Tax=Corchorus capsularis TaxID=210143 RepID=A0A1R3H0S9_COCAP|nr:Ribosomal protein S4e [Corchorus capsularis]
MALHLNSILLATFPLLFLLIQTTPSISLALTSTDDSPSAYEILEGYNFPIGILPKGVLNYDLDESTGRFHAYLNGSCSFSLEGSYQLKYKSTISGYVSNNKLRDLSGVSVKVLFLWLNIVEVTRHGDQLEFSVGIASASFPIDNFYECPQCGCGLDCVNAKARGLKKHLKRLNAPRHWMLDKLGGAFAPKPSSGPHKSRECLPLILILRNRLKYALTYREVIAILMQRHVMVDGKVRTDKTYPAGFMDVVSIPKTNEDFRLLYDTKGRFRLHAIAGDETKFKLCKVRSVQFGQKGIPYLNTYDGRTLRYPDPLIKPNDTIKLDLESNKIVDFIKFDVGNVVMVTGGRNRGRVGVIKNREKHKGSFETIHIQDATGHEFATRLGNVFTIGKGTKPWFDSQSQSPKAVYRSAAGFSSAGNAQQLQRSPKKTCFVSNLCVVREPDRYSIWNGPPFNNNNQPGIKIEKVPCVSAKFSEDGTRIVVTKSDSSITVYESNTLKEIRCFQIPNVTASALSPRGTYLQTFQKSTTPQEKNAVLWNVETGDFVYQQFQKNMTKATWPSIQFSSDESVACRLATNEIQFFDATDFSKGILYRLRIPGVTAVELSKAPGSHVAAFVPESKGSPASVQIYACGKELQSQPLARRSFFRCSTVQLHWNRGSTGLLVVVQSDVDKTNQSYYGESKLNYLTTDGAHEGLVPLRKEGPIHDVQWSYSGKEFAVVYGFMPASATIFDKKCKPLLELGSGPYNTIRWNPKGKFLCLAGFGNLPGDMAFWDFIDKKQLGTTRAECSVTSEWSADGRYFMTATTAPRLQVDNCIKIFHYNGALFFKKMFDKLFQADWKAETPDKFGEIAELIKSVDSMKVEEPKSQGQGSTSKKPTSSNPPAQKPAAYRPPHAKNAAAVQAEVLSDDYGVLG